MDQNAFLLVLKIMAMVCQIQLILESSTGFGLKLVKMLSKHLSGKIAIIRNKGTKVTIEFHLEF
jgi:two-component sensor histidine kinase